MSGGGAATPNAAGGSKGGAQVVNTGQPSRTRMMAPGINLSSGGFGAGLPTNMGGQVPVMPTLPEGPGPMPMPGGGAQPMPGGGAGGAKGGGRVANPTTGQSYADVVMAGGGGINPGGMYTGGNVGAAPVAPASSVPDLNMATATAAAPGLFNYLGNTVNAFGNQTTPTATGVATPVAGSATLGGVPTTPQPAGGQPTTDGMVYTGGTPNFDESTGTYTDGRTTTGGAAPSGPEALFNNTLATIEATTNPTPVTETPQPRFNLVQSSADAIQNATQGTQGLLGFSADQISSGAAGSQGYDAVATSAEQAASQGYGANTVGSQGYGIERAGSRGYDAREVGSQGYTASEAGSQGYDAIANAAAERARSQGYGAERIAGVGPVRAERIQGVDPIVAERARSGQIADTDLSRYTNPFENQVVQQSLSDLERARQIQQNVQGAQAQAAGAFGGSRQAIAEAETNRAFAEQAARTASGLRQAGFTQAQQAAQSDIASRLQADLANQRSALQAGTTTAQLGQQAQIANQTAGLQADTTTAQLGQQAQALNQAAANQAAQFTAGAANQASLQNAQLGTQAILANQAARNRAAEFTSQAANTAALQNAAARNAAMQFGADAANRAQLANQAAVNQAAQFGAQASNVANLQNAAAQNQASQFGAQAANTAGLANQAALNQAAQFGAQAANVAALQNAQLGTQANLANQAAQNQAAQFTAGAANQASLANQAAAMQAQIANQNAQLQSQNFNLAALNQLGNFGMQQFDMANQINQSVAQQGALEQAAQQAIIDAARGQYAGFVGSPQQALQTALGAFAGSQTGQQTQTTSRQPGLFDYLTLGAQISDVRLKKNVTPIGKARNGLNLYAWEWNEAANAVGQHGSGAGVIAQEAQVLRPEAVTRGSDGYLRVDYNKVLV
ncbi:MAG: hypothetical protein Unbinned1502contig1001_25 [Prokaryotic dsDNA virus sp.]|nr:MAG: hypothetical protein Unbinned1502contig1001_25 [Prokaryotic dsDNA virus sp.]